jgi:glucose/arabinose dehydrogenase
MLQAPGDDTHWFVVEKGGVVRVFPNNPNATLSDVDTFVDLSLDVDSTFGESGLLGMAFHPEFETNGFVFLSYTRTGAGVDEPLQSVVSRFEVDATGNIDSDTEAFILVVSQPFGNHNGGNIVFGPDGFLYIGLGDGGNGGDPLDHGQDTTTLLGSVLRIDIDSASPYAIPPANPFAHNPECFQATNAADCPEIFAWGFRNPWRFTFDRETDDLWLGDVGQNAFEEVDRVELSGNYGWNVREGAHCFDPPEGCSTESIDPITEYDHALGSSITGGYVYRGSAIPDLAGFYLFGDFGSGRIWAVSSTSEQGVEPEELIDTGLSIASFAESNAGELFVVDLSAGTLHQIVSP